MPHTEIVETNDYIPPSPHPFTVNTNTNSQPTGPETEYNAPGTTDKNNPTYLQGDLAPLNAIPLLGAGTSTHGVDTDVPLSDWAKHAPPSHLSTNTDVDFVEAVKPLIVSVVDMPIMSEERNSRIWQLFSALEPYTFTSVGEIDTSSRARVLLPFDDTRTSAIIMALPSPNNIAATGSNQYMFLISDTQQCLSGIILGSPTGVNSITIHGKSAVYGRIVPLAAYDITKTNNYILSAISTNARIVGINK